MKALLLVVISALWAGSVSAKEILLVVHGGHISCPRATNKNPLPPLNLHFAERLALLEKDLTDAGNELHTLTACLDNDPPPTGVAQFVSSRTPDTLQFGNAAALKTEIETFHDLYPNLSVYLAGHSYGGFTAMHLSTVLDSKVNIAGLFTIDPISTLCGSVGGENCHQAPVDFDNAAIKARVGTWENFFQNNDSWLESSRITEANNHDIDSAFPAHIRIANDEHVWKVVKSAIEKE